MSNDKRQKIAENKGWKFRVVCSTATQFLKKAPVIATNGNTTIKGNSWSDCLTKVLGY